MSNVCLILVRRHYKRICSSSPAFLSYQAPIWKRAFGSGLMASGYPWIALCDRVIVLSAACSITSGCYFWLNQRVGTPIKPDGYEGLRLYWIPSDLHELRHRLLRLGYAASEIVNRDYGQTEFSVTDDDGYSHCFGVATQEGPMILREPPNP